MIEKKKFSIERQHSPKQSSHGIIKGTGLNTFHLSQMHGCGDLIDKVLYASNPWGTRFRFRPSLKRRELHPRGAVWL
jgi:hypothetical protein